MTDWTKTLDEVPADIENIVEIVLPSTPDTLKDVVTNPIPEARQKPFLREAPASPDFMAGYRDALAFQVPPEKFTESYTEGYTFGCLVRGTPWNAVPYIQQPTPTWVPCAICSTLWANHRHATPTQYNHLEWGR